MPALLAVDVGLRLGLAYYGSDGRLRRYGSHNFGTRQRLRKAVPSLLAEWPDLTRLILEGGGDVAEIWVKEAQRRQIGVQVASAESWRSDLLYDREQRTADRAKSSADPLARLIIAWSGAPAPTSLRHDAVEAILVGFWAVLRLGWLHEMPVEIQQRFHNP